MDKRLDCCVFIVEEEKGTKDSEASQGDGSETGNESEPPDDGELTNDDDSDFDPDDDPDKLWCFCKKPHGNRYCVVWFFQCFFFYSFPDLFNSEI